MLYVMHVLDIISTTRFMSFDGSSSFLLLCNIAFLGPKDNAASYQLRW